MNEIQKKLLNVITPNGFGRISLSELGRKIGISNRQLVKYHLDRLQKAGLIVVTVRSGYITNIAPKISHTVELASLPIYGSANCGPASLIAEENFEGYLKVSKRLLNTARTDSLFVLRASGDSMNDAEVNNVDPINDGDYIIIDSSYTNPKEGDYIVSVIDGSANIKRIFLDDEKIILKSESKSPHSYPPIYIHPDDNYLINGKVIQVIKGR
jgi:repressor LexA